ncbi:MAG TPA: GNAT family protein [Chthonomonadaceae bacterium]|nr:GNAT family protein [Chthonomonadaceae bacterium]
MTVPDLTTPIFNLRGEKVALGPLRRDLIPVYTRWVNEFEGQFTFSSVEPITKEQRTASYERWSRDREDTTFTIYEAASLRPVGMTGIWILDRFAHSGFIFIYIGAKERRGRGYGGEAMALVMDYGSHALNLQSLEVTVIASNIAGIRAYQRAGFRIIGRRREAVRVGNRIEDFLYMHCLAEEFHSPALARLPDV